MISNDKNIYVNPAWNQALDYFENSGFSHLVIMNSDLVMRDGWYDVLEAAVGMGDDISFFPELVGKGTPTETWDGERITLEPIDKHISGVFIFMSRRLAKFLGRFPEEVKVWFGDTYFYDLINRTMFMSAMVKELKAFHFGSRTIKRVKDIHELIDKDKVVWEEKVKPELESRIESFVKI
jgi:hypothetical protein